MSSAQNPSIDMEQFNRLMARRKRVSLTLTAIMLCVYFGFILVLAFAKDMFSTPISGHITMWLPIGIGIIFSAWLMTGIYVRWANKTYDRLVEQVKDSAR